MFMTNLKETINEEFNTSVTENGAVGYRTTGKELLDINFSVTSMRNMDEQQIVDKFVKTFYEDRLLAVKWLFYARDIRGGIGERRLFRYCLKYLASNHSDIAKAIIPLVPEYGRWDDLWCLLDTEVVDYVVHTVSNQLVDDIKNRLMNKPISLLAKWLPSINTSSKETRKSARILIRKLRIREKAYRKMLVDLRGYLKVVEVNMCKNEWSEIDYAAVPSRANLIYNDAFTRNDPVRRRKYLDSLQKGETKINAGVLFPHDIVHKYMHNEFWRSCVFEQTEVALEELWKALPDYVNGAGNTICVADGSRSMTSTVGETGVTALDVANALAIYFAERSSGDFKDKYITFSMNPRLVDFSNCKTLREKIEMALHYNEAANTNIEAVFDLILKTAIRNNMSQYDIPQNILILSDMEFDAMARWGDHYTKMTSTLFDTIADKYTEHGYKLPRLIFWNICSRTGTISVKENEFGIALVSGFSPAVANMVLSNKLDPLECLLEQLNSDRYSAVEDALKRVQA